MFTLETPIKVNYTNYGDKRTSTTISSSVAWFYFNHCSEKDKLEENGKLEEEDALGKQNILGNIIQNRVNEQRWASKHQIENRLLLDAKKYISDGFL